jgi:hypothetical protein
VTELGTYASTQNSFLIPFPGSWQRERTRSRTNPRSTGVICEWQHNTIRSVHEVSCIMIASIATLIHDGIYHNKRQGRWLCSGSKEDAWGQRGGTGRGRAYLRLNSHLVLYLNQPSGFRTLSAPQKTRRRAPPDLHCTNKKAETFL